MQNGQIRKVEDVKVWAFYIYSLFTTEVITKELIMLCSKLNVVYKMYRYILYNLKLIVCLAAARIKRHYVNIYVVVECAALVLCNINKCTIGICT